MFFTLAAKSLIDSPIFKLSGAPAKALGMIAAPIAALTSGISPFLDAFNTYSKFKSGNIADSVYHISKTASDVSLFLTVAAPLVAIPILPAAIPITAAIGLTGMLGYGIHKLWHGQYTMNSFTVTEWFLEAARLAAQYSQVGALIAGTAAAGSFAYNWWNNSNVTKDGYTTIIYTAFVTSISVAASYFSNNERLKTLKFWSIDFPSKLKDLWALGKELPEISASLQTIKSLHAELESCIGEQKLGHATSLTCVNLKSAILAAKPSGGLVKGLDQHFYGAGTFLDKSIFSIYPGMLKPGIEAYTNGGNSKQWIDASTKTQGYVKLWDANTNSQGKDITAKKIIDLMSQPKTLTPQRPESHDDKALKIIKNALDLTEDLITKSPVNRAEKYGEYYLEEYCPYFSSTIGSQIKEANPAKFAKDILTHPLKKTLPLESAFVITEAKLITDIEFQNFCKSNSPKSEEWNNVCKRINALLPAIKTANSGHNDVIQDAHMHHSSLPLPMIAEQFLNNTPTKITPFASSEFDSTSSHSFFAYPTIDFHHNLFSTITGAYTQAGKHPF